MPDSDAHHQPLYDVIGRIYDAAFDDTLWAGLAPEVARLLDAPSASMHVRYADGDAQLLDATQNLLPSASHLREQAGYWRRNDIWVRRAREVGLGRILLSEELYSDSEFERSRFYQDWCRHLEIFYVMGSIFPLAGGQIGGFGVHRPHGEAPFTEQQRQRARLFMQHYRRALEMRRHFHIGAIEKEATGQALLRSQSGVLALSAQRRVLYACPVAEAMLRNADGLRMVAGQVVTASRAGMDGFERRIAEALFWTDAPPASVPALTDGNSGVMAISRAGRLPLTVRVAPLRPPSLRMTIPAVLVLVRDPECLSLNPADLRELFGLTQMEAMVACRLAEGLSIESIAHAQGVTLNTARSHLKNILSKTNTTRQAEAVALILRSLPALAAISTPDVRAACASSPR